MEKTGYPQKMLFGHSEPDIEKLPSEMPRTRTDQNLAGESFDHIEGFFKILKDVEKRNAGILSDGERVWNMDETSISCEFGKRTKVFGSSQTHHGGFVASSTESGCGTNVTAVIAVSASGRKNTAVLL